MVLYEKLLLLLLWLSMNGLQTIFLLDRHAMLCRASVTVVHIFILIYSFCIYHKTKYKNEQSTHSSVWYESEHPYIYVSIEIITFNFFALLSSRIVPHVFIFVSLFMWQGSDFNPNGATTTKKSCVYEDSIAIQMNIHIEQECAVECVRMSEWFFCVINGIVSTRYALL